MISLYRSSRERRELPGILGQSAKETLARFVLSRKCVASAKK